MKNKNPDQFPTPEEPRRELRLDFGANHKRPQIQEEALAQLAETMERLFTSLGPIIDLKIESSGPTSTLIRESRSFQQRDGFEALAELSFSGNDLGLTGTRYGMGPTKEEITRGACKALAEQKLDDNNGAGDIAECENTDCGLSFYRTPEDVTKDVSECAGCVMAKTEDI